MIQEHSMEAITRKITCQISNLQNTVLRQYRSVRYLKKELSWFPGVLLRKPFCLSEESLIWFSDHWRCVPESLAIEGGFGLVY